MSVLIVEDNPLSARVLEINLRKCGYQTMVAHTGREALARLGATPGIRLVITDVMMPEMDGWELLRAMKDSPEWNRIPVIVSTVLADAEAVKTAARMGCRHYLVKPIDAAQLLEKVRAALDREKPVLRDKREIMSDLGIDLQAYESVIRTFAVQVGQVIARLERQAALDEDEGLPTEILALWESAAVLGAERVTDLLDRLAATEESLERDADSDRVLLLKELTLLHHELTVSLEQETARAAAADANGALVGSKSDRWAEALHAYHEAVRLNPADAVVWGGLGVFAYAAHGYGDAVRAFERALALDPFYFETRLPQRKIWEESLRLRRQQRESSK
ncbi:MAG: response regulator [Candidatus Methylomirabilia bacterium]